MGQRMLLPAAACLLAVGLALGWPRGCNFAPVPGSPDVFVCRQPFSLGPIGLTSVQLSPVLIRVPASQGLVFKKRTWHWVLVDAGDGPGARQLVQAVQRKLNPEKKKETSSLDLILVTHAHADHTGALGELLEAYPAARVCAHVEELRFLLGDHPASHFEGPGLLNRLLRAGAGKPVGVPLDRVAVVHGAAGDVADALHGLAKDDLKWLPHGTLRWVHTPGHTPGHMALLHAPSGVLVAGDTVMPTLLSSVLSSVLGERWRQLGPPIMLVSSCPAVVKPRAKQLLEQEDYRLVLPYHGGTFTREQALRTVESWPSAPLGPCGHQESEAAPAGTQQAEGVVKEGASAGAVGDVVGSGTRPAGGKGAAEEGGSAVME